MQDESWKTLFPPVRSCSSRHAGCEQPRPVHRGRIPEFRLPEGFSARLTIVQGFRPAFLELEKRGLDVFPQFEGDGYDVALVLAGRHRGQNEIWMREAAARLREGGLVVVAASKKNGGDSFAPSNGRGCSPLGGHLSKHHGMVFWFDKPAAPLPEPRRPPGGGDQTTVFRTAPGMFSHGRIDVGSRLLASQIAPERQGHHRGYRRGLGVISPPNCCHAKPATLPCHLYEADFCLLRGGPAPILHRCPRAFASRCSGVT